MSKARGYLIRDAKSGQGNPENREWQLIFARTYRMLAEAENEVVVARRLPAAAYCC